jgi:hypothetical protein
MAFNEVIVMRDNLDFVSKSLGIEVEVQDATAFSDEKIVKLPTPGAPILVAV